MNKFLFLILLILLSLSLNAQSFYGGLTIGTTFSQVDGDDHGGFHKISPLGGVYVRNTYNSNWGSSLGIEYKQKGSKAVKKNSYGYIITVSYTRLDYVELPFLINYKLEKIKIPKLIDYDFKTDFWIDFGFSAAYLIKGTDDFGHGPVLPTGSREFKKYEIANHLGLNYYLNDHWILYARFSYTFPLLPIRKHPGGQVYWINRGQYNHNLSFAIKYEF